MSTACPPRRCARTGTTPSSSCSAGPVRYLVDAKSQAEKRAFSHFVIPRFTRTRLPDANGIQAMYAGIVDDEAETSC